MFAYYLILLLTAAVCTAVPSQPIRPCRHLNRKCIADNLSKNSKCNAHVRGAVPSRYTIPSFEFHTAYFNATNIDNNLVVHNHDKCRVSEFFFNLANYNLVLGLDCAGLRFESTREVVQHYSLRESTRYSYSYNGTYPLVRFTIVFRLTGPLDLCSTLAFADVTALPIFDINPNDVKTAKFLSTDLTFLNIFERETFFYRANQLARYYINSVLCDFGCNY